jgi:parallel beta-helix repeat protein
MQGEPASIIMLSLLVVSALALAHNVQPVKSDYVWTETIYIRADGSIDPPTAPISTVDNVTYVLTGNITSDADGIVVERSNIIIDGAGYTIQETGSGYGFYLSNVNSVTIKSTNIKGFYYGLYFYFSSNNTIFENNITNNTEGIYLSYSSNNTISGNNLTANNGDGIYLYSSSYNKLSGNSIENGAIGVAAYSSSYNNTLSSNIIMENSYMGIYLEGISDAVITNNTIAFNANWGIGLSNFDNVVFSYNNVSFNDGAGIRQGGSVCYVTFLSNTVSYNKGSGISLSNYDGDNTVDSIYNIAFLSNNVSYNQGDGISLEMVAGEYGSHDYVHDVEFSNNTVSSNSGYGIQMYGEVIIYPYYSPNWEAFNITFSSNDISFNGYGGISLNCISYDADSYICNVSFSYNNVSFNQGKGISINSCGKTYSYIYNVEFLNNTVSSNGEDGIDLISSGEHYASLTTYIHNVAFLNNTISSNNRKGIYIYSCSYEGDSLIYNVTFSSNDILSNSGEGAYLCSEGSGTYGSYEGYIYDVTFSFNNVSFNTGNGIYLSACAYGISNPVFAYSSIFNVTFLSNNVLFNSGSGIYMYSVGIYDSSYGAYSYIYNVTVLFNKLYSNSLDGIQIYSDVYGYEPWRLLANYAYIYNMVVSSNVISSNKENGVYAVAKDHYAAEFDLTLSDNTVSANYQRGIWIEGSITANLTRNSISYNTFGVFYTRAATNLAQYNDIYRNSYGVNVTDGATVNAENNYWGDSSGPYHESLNPDGKGNSVNGDGTDLDFAPFLTDPLGQINERPVATLGADKTVAATNGTVTFDGSTSTDDNQIEYYFFDFGDGTKNSWTASPTVTHKYASAGVYNATLIVMDNLGVTSLDGNLTFVTITVMDSTPPTTVHDYDCLWHTADFTITLTATDDSSGVAETYYKTNDDPTKTVSADGQPLITTEGASNKIEYWSADNAGNEELPHRILTGIKLDKTIPSIGVPSRDPAGDVQPGQSVNVSLNVTDATSQVKNASLYYSLNNATTWELPTPMNYNASTGLYEATISGQQAGTWVRFKIIAYDCAGNNATLGETEPHHTYQVIPEFPTVMILPLFIVLTLFAVIFRRKSKMRQTRFGD